MGTESWLEDRSHSMFDHVLIKDSSTDVLAAGGGCPQEYTRRRRFDRAEST